MNYLDEFRKFIYGHYLFSGLRLTLAALIPCLIFYHYDIMDQMIAFPLGSLLIGSTDNPGPAHRRRNALIISIVTCFTVACVTGFLRHIYFITFIEIIVFGMFFSLIGVYGNRVNSIGLIALLVFIFNIDDHLSGDKVLLNALIFTAGGIWYLILFVVLNKIRPYKLIQQLLGENFAELGTLLAIKAKNYQVNPDFDSIFNQLMHQQVILRENHENLREILFKTRQIVSESTNKSRILMLMFLDSIDMMERILDSQQDYSHLHKAFDHTKILRLFGTYISWLSVELQEIGLATQSGFASRPRHDLDAGFHKCQNAFLRLREHLMTHDNMEDFIMLRQILNSLQDMTERIKKLHLATSYDAELSDKYKLDVEPDNFTPKQEYHPRILLDNLSLKSSHFRHSVRVTLGLMIGFIGSLFLDVGHSYWILLTIVTIMKPAFSITKQRNLYRVAGTIVGALSGFIILYFVKDNASLFIIMMVTMTLAYSFLKLNYFIASIGITLYVILSFNFLNPHHIADVLQDRVIDTVIGCAIAYLVSSFVLPVWEHTQINQYIKEALKANQDYFDTVSRVLSDVRVDINDLKLHRKNAIIAMANLSDNFQRMLSEPKKQQIKQTEYHQFVATSHMLTSYIASLSSYAQAPEKNYETAEFKAIIEQIDQQFGANLALLNGVKDAGTDLIKKPLPQNKQLQQLLSLRKKEIREVGIQAAADSGPRKTLSDLKTINGLFELISTITIDEIKILQKIVA